MYVYLGLDLRLNRAHGINKRKRQIFAFNSIDRFKKRHFRDGEERRKEKYMNKFI